MVLAFLALAWLSLVAILAIAPVVSDRSDPCNPGPVRTLIVPSLRAGSFTRTPELPIGEIVVRER
jgi:hypothetical protein